MWQLDLLLFHSVNAWCGNWVLDRIVAYEESNYLFKGGILLAAYWWFWFSGDERQRLANRRIVVAAIIGTIVALAVNRAIATTLPFRIRPMYMPDIGYHAPSIFFRMNLEHWSSFPSDSATFWFALSLGLFRLHRLLGLFFLIYSALWMCLARLYLGIHYPSDLIAGALLGAAVVWTSVVVMTAQDGAASRRLMSWLSALEQNHPQLFYAAAFLLSFELTMMFDDLRNLVRATVHMLHVSGYLGINENVALFIVGGCMLILGAIVGLSRKLRRRWLAQETAVPTNPSRARTTG